MAEMPKYQHFEEKKKEFMHNLSINACSNQNPTLLNLNLGWKDNEDSQL
jgi:hypothetical protein